MNDGYPEDDDLAVLENFEGTPLEFAEKLHQLLKATGYAGYSISRQTTPFFKGWGVSISTGGWSGAEEIMSVVQGTMFHYLFWHEISRGGGFTYRIPYSLAESSTELGVLVGS